MDALYSQMRQHMGDRVLKAEMQAHLGHERHRRSGGNAPNSEGRKRVQCGAGDL